MSQEKNSFLDAVVDCETGKVYSGEENFGTIKVQIILIILIINLFTTF
jgi:hypothetical protein